MSHEPTRPSPETRAAERDEAETKAHADRSATPEEERLAETHDLDPDTVEHEGEMLERGAHQKGEGRIP